ncbi:YfcL family protein [Tatumella saanichensis]|uniref:YfcL family protein n=1 Tax=Tatumella saanichensis TaxID=480813 RepID=UPI0004A21A0A|nr:YfcL family protein [Tatumella saanichensis]
MIETEAKILAIIDEMVDSASDDQLFAGGYIRGHLTQSVAELENEGLSSSADLKQRVEQSLQSAIAQKELSPPDQVLVLEMWYQLYQQAANA